MISLLQRAEMRRLFYAEHWPIGTVADALAASESADPVTPDQRAALEVG